MDKKIKCEKCKSTYVYSLKDETIVCRKCGHRNKKKEVKHGNLNK